MKTTAPDYEEMVPLAARDWLMIGAVYLLLFGLLVAAWLILRVI